MTTELAGVVSRFQADGRNLGVDPMAQGGTLVTTLANTAAHHHGFEFWGISTTDVGCRWPPRVLGRDRPAPPA